jgi:hypothetical protein
LNRHKQTNHDEHKRYKTKFMSFTAAAVLAFAIAQVGASPSAHRGEHRGGERGRDEVHHCPLPDDFDS